MSAQHTVSARDARSWYADTPLLPPAEALKLGPTLVIAPHPDDEVLGCGGTIALLRAAQIPVRVVIVSDGAASHPGSVRYPPPVLGALRESESLDGLAHVGVLAESVDFLGLPDGAVPSAGDPQGARTVERLRDALVGWADLQTVLVPWRRDPHHDHRAVSSLATAALDTSALPVRRLEYPIWARVHPGRDDLPRTGEATIHRLDISTVGEVKRAAIMAHRSQTTDLIDDATVSYCLPDDVLACFSEPSELLLEGLS